MTGTAPPLAPDLTQGLRTAETGRDAPARP